MTDNEGRRLLENEDQRLLEDVEHPLENLDMDLLLENRLGEFGRYGVHFQRGSRMPKRQVTAVWSVNFNKRFRLGCPTGYRVSTILTAVECLKEGGLQGVLHDYD